jgi:hypothetical protein
MCCNALPEKVFLDKKQKPKLILITQFTNIAYAITLILIIYILLCAACVAAYREDGLVKILALPTLIPL